MAFGGLQQWELLCPVCETFIEQIDDDLQRSLDYHFSNVHPNVNNLYPSDNQVKLLTNYGSANKAYHARNELTSYLMCPLCDHLVEIFQNNINHFFMEHFGIYHENIITKPGRTDNISDEKKGGNLNETIKSVEKSGDNVLDIQGLTSTIETQFSFDLQQDLKSQSGYISQDNHCFMCHICSETLNTQQVMQEHLKTKRHADNIITFLKGKLSSHMHGVMEFVSFCGFNLFCNLCSCKIDSNSNNAHETLINIISHNSDAKHSQKKYQKDERQSSVGYSALQSVSEKNPIVNEHKDFIEIEMEPHFTCKLCEKIIHYSKNYIELEHNFVTHIKSVLHTKNSKASFVLQIFREINSDMNRKHCFLVSNGFVDCKTCECTIPANIEQLLEHSQNNVHVGLKQLIEKQNVTAPSSYNKPSLVKENKTCPEKNTITKLTHRTSGAHSNSGQSKTIKGKEIKGPRINIKAILDPLANQFGNLSCIAENEEKSLTCIICNCGIQPTTHCVKMHIMGKFHKNKMHCQIKELKTLNSNEGETSQEVHPDGAKTLQESGLDLIDHLFQSLPQRFQEEKRFFAISLSDGSVHCTLCNCMIDPLFLEIHLQNEGHLQQKQLMKRA